MDSKNAAQVLYFQGLKQKEIAELLHVQEQTISTWKIKGKWEQKRAEQSLRQESTRDKIWELIDHNVSVMHKKVMDAKANEELIQSDKGDVDALFKLYSAVKGSQENWAHYVKIIKEFIEYISIIDLHLSKEIMPHADTFLNDKRKDI